MKHIKEFDGLRGLLALWVFGAHVIELGPYWSATRHVHASWAVDIFIILSGFVIFHLLSRGEDYGTFITRRWFRLFPVFAVCFLLAWALYAGLGIQDEIAFGIGHETALAPYLISHLTMLHGVVPNEILLHSAEAILPPAWSISVEWQFYLLAPLLFIFATRPTLKTALVVAGLVALRVLQEAGQLGVLFPGGPRRLSFDMNAFLPLKLEFFAIGGACCALWHWLCRRPVVALPRWGYAAFAAVTVLVGFRSPAISLWLIFFGIVLQSKFGAASGFLRRGVAIVNGGVSQFLGRISYSVYLLHLPVLILARHGINRLFPDLAPLQFQVLLIASALPLTLAGAWILNVVVEGPMIEMGKRITRRWKTQSPATGVASAVTNA
jgi:peptidoglycan/LPS O-acetylase OafA/YrhL